MLNTVCFWVALLGPVYTCIEGYRINRGLRLTQKRSMNKLNIFNLTYFVVLAIYLVTLPAGLGWSESISALLPSIICQTVLMLMTWLNQRAS